MIIAPDTIAEVKERAHIVEVVSESVKLKRAGSNYVGLCPFHGEKTGSFHVREEGYFHCFGCGESGNVISFVMKQKGLSFREAIEDLASRFGIAVKYEGSVRPLNSPKEDPNAIYRVNEIAWRYFTEQYRRSGKEAESYLRERSISDEAQRAFGLGYSPSGWTLLKDHLTASKVPEALIISSGLVRRNSRGELMDSFRERIIFPVFVDDRRIAGFGGRILPSLQRNEHSNPPPKYINSSETSVYQKSKIFYGLPQAISAIRKTSEVYLVEGYMDVIGLWQFGVRNAIATCGTAVTEKHVDRLKHIAKKVIFLFDGDSAGRAGAGKAFPLFLNSGIDVCASFLPEGEDPDTFALKNRENAVSVVEGLERVALFDCYLDGKMQSVGAEHVQDIGAANKGRLCQDLAEVLKTVRNAIERDELIKRAAMRLRVDPSVLSGVVEKASSTTKSLGVRAEGKFLERHEDLKTSQGNSEFKERGVIPAISDLPALDRELLRIIMVLKDEITGEVLKESTLCQVIKPVTIEFIEVLDEALSTEGLLPEQKKDAVRTLLARMGESWVKHWKESYKMYEGKESADFWVMYEDCRSAAKRAGLIDRIEELTKELGFCQDDNKKLELLKEQVELKRSLSTIS